MGGPHGGPHAALIGQIHWQIEPTVSISITVLPPPFRIRARNWSNWAQRLLNSSWLENRSTGSAFCPARTIRQGQRKQGNASLTGSRCRGESVWGPVDRAGREADWERRDQLSKSTRRGRHLADAGGDGLDEWLCTEVKWQNPMKCKIFISSVMIVERGVHDHHEIQLPAAAGVQPVSRW